MPDFEAELARRLRAPIDDGVVELADDIAVCVERRIAVRRRMAAVAVATGAVAMMVAILFGVRIADEALPLLRAGTAASVALRVPLAILAVALTLAAGTIAVALPQAAR